MKHFDSFGVMIDCSRDAVPSVDGLKRFLNTIARMGYNVAMLYTEETYEVENEPYFGYKRGRYSTEELREIDYANGEISELKEPLLPYKDTYVTHWSEMISANIV